VYQLFKKARDEITKPLRIPFAIYRLRKETEKSKNLEEIVELSYKFRVGARIIPLQHKEEILELLKILKKMKPKNILEIGTATGGTLFLFTQVAHPEAKIVSIDLLGRFRGWFGGAYSRWDIPLYKSFATKNQKIHLIRADSHEILTLRKVKSVLGKEKLDFLFIDGDHTYRGVKKDFEMYSRLIERNKVIALHDIIYAPLVRGCHVDVFWKELKTKYPKTREIVSSTHRNWGGIGVIFT
jgi:predicted O-methyltransferase YrrM